MKVIIGDWNAKVGTDNDGWETVMERDGHENIVKAEKD